METPGCPSKQLPADGYMKPKLRALRGLAAAGFRCCRGLGDHPSFRQPLLHQRHVDGSSSEAVYAARFHHRLPKARTAAVLLCRGKSWTVNYCGELKLKKFDMAWMDFAVDNRLRVGDACVFELMIGAGSEGNDKEEEEEEEEEGMTFQVQILRGGLPEEVTSKGATSDEPIVIGD